MIIQSDGYLELDIASITVCPLTSEQVEAPVLRQAVIPSQDNGLNRLSYLMVDKVFTVPANRVGRAIGTLAHGDIARLDRALMIFLGLSD